MSIWIVPLVAIAYAALLFWVADAGDRPEVADFAKRFARPILGLSICVYCTSWTFFGAVGTSAARGLQYLPIYLGPILLFVVWGKFVERVLQTGKVQHSTSIADFLSARFGKSAWVAALVTLIAASGALPYMALQLKSVSQTLSALSPELTEVLGHDNVVLAVAGAMAAFAVLFGTGRLELTRHNRGVVLAIALEAAVKFVALAAVALFATILLTTRVSLDAVADHAARTYSLQQIDTRFAIMTVCSAVAALCLPRQFHMLVVEATEDRLKGSARWLFPVYLALISAAVVPVVLAGGLLAPADIAPDMLMIELPLAYGESWLAVLSFIGGLSASTGMIIVTSIALSSMITNDLIVPLFFRDQMRRGSSHQPVGRALINIRRATIASLVLFAFVYVRSIDQEATLAGLGELAFAGVVQFAPGLLLGFVWRKANRAGMIAGLGAGYLLWLLLLALPVFGFNFAPPIIGEDPLVSGVVISLAANISMFILFSLASEPALVDRVQAIAFIDRGQPDLGTSNLTTRTRVADFRLLLEQFLGRDQAREAINRLRFDTGRKYADAETPDEDLIETTERMISSIIGSSSARALIQSTLEGDPMPVERVVAMFDETSQRLHFGGEVLQIAIENIDQGVSVVDGEQRLVAWNSRYVEMFDFPEGLVEVGQPIADLIRYNMREMQVPEASIEREVAKRLDHLRGGKRYTAERELIDGRTLRILGNPAPNGGYVTSYSDITADRQAEQALEAKVRERTEQLVEANVALEAATRSKTRFLAAASHDLVQPMNAARLFASALHEELRERDGHEAELLGQIDKSIETADRLLRALLDISRLDGGKMRVDAEPFCLDAVLSEIRNEFEIQAENKGLALSVMPCRLWLETDRGLLVSLLQNLVTNAVRYSESGRILVGAKRRGGEIEIFVIDQGPGISEAEQARIFDEFTRLPGREHDEGLGLGLAIVRRIAVMLGTQVNVVSKPGRGSCFHFRLPTTSARESEVRPARGRHAAAAVENAHVLCVDNDPGSLKAVESLLARWGYSVTTATGPNAISLTEPPDLVVMDYRLDDGLTGDRAFETLNALWQVKAPAILLTAEDTEETKAAADRMGASRLIKPVSPPALRALINSILD